MNEAKDQLQTFLGTIPGTVEEPPSHVHLLSADDIPALTKTHFSMDFSVNYSGVSVPTVEYLHEDFAP